MPHALLGNLTVTDTTAPSFLTVSPTAVAPTTSSVNWAAGVTMAHETTTMVALDHFRVLNNAGDVDVLFDVAGWYG